MLRILKKSISPIVLIPLVLMYLLRVMPHIANFVPMIFLILFIGKQSKSKYTLALCVLMCLLSDITIGLMSHQPIFGMWSLFTYSAYIAIFAASFVSKTHKKSILSSLPVLIVPGVLLFWLWTNFGVWLCSPYYAHSLSGLLACFTLAIPFLKTSLVGNVAALAIWSLLKTAFDFSARFGKKHQLV